MGLAVGIDLGTTNSCLAVVQGNKATVISDHIGRRIHPSVVSFLPDGTSVASYEARERQITDPRNTVSSFKRLIGRDFNGPEAMASLADLPYEVGFGPDHVPLIRVRDQEVSLPEISALMLRHLKELCSESLGAEVDKAVITVPANFNDVQRSSTKIAGRIAGFEVLRILNEPTAAALAYGFGGERSEKIAIYDFGGGTFDITIVELAGDIFKVLATAGDTALGGDDFDTVIVEEMRADFIDKHGVDLAGNTVAMQRLRLVAERVKCQLSCLEHVEATLPEIAENRAGRAIDFHFKMSKSRFEGLCRPLVDRSLDVCVEAFKLAGIDRSSVDNLVLVGGSTRIPLIRNLVGREFGVRPRVEINPDEVVAIGAAIQAFSLTRYQMSRPSAPPEPYAADKRCSSAPPVVWSDGPKGRESSGPLPAVLDVFSDASSDAKSCEGAGGEPPAGGSRRRPSDDFGWLDLGLSEPPEEPHVKAPRTSVIKRRKDVVHGAPSWPPMQQGDAFSVDIKVGATNALLLDVTPRALGIGTAGGFCDTIIERNAAIPVEQSRLFTTSYDGQTEVVVNIYQGESRRVSDNTRLGQVLLSSIRAAPRGEIKIRVTFEIDTDGILGVFARNEETGEAQSTRIVLSGGLDEITVRALVEKYASE